MKTVLIKIIDNHSTQMACTTVGEIYAGIIVDPNELVPSPWAAFAGQKNTFDDSTLLLIDDAGRDVAVSFEDFLNNEYILVDNGQKGLNANSQGYDLIKVMLLSDNGYPDMLDVSFPVEVTGWFNEEDEIFNILGSEIIRIAGQCPIDPWDPDFWYAFDPDYIEMKEENVK